jgi:hypothetical protein
VITLQRTPSNTHSYTDIQLGWLTLLNALQHPLHKGEDSQISWFDLPTFYCC